MRAAIAALLAGACTVGPKYERPDAPVPAAYKESSRWQRARPQDGALKGSWWQMFHEPELDALEAELNQHNQNIAQSFESFQAARALVAQARAQYYPTVTFAPSYSALGLGSASGASRFGSTTGQTAPAPTGGGGSRVVQVYQLPADVSWAPDLWGRVRNLVRENRYAAQVSAADLENVRLTQQALLAELYFQLRGQDALQDLYTHTVESYRKALEYARARAATGVDSEEAVAQAEVTLRTAEATATGIAINRALYEHAIATLCGKPASSFALRAQVLRTPAPVIPVGIPSRLLERRPDIAAAERAMAQANAAIGVAKAAYFPTLTLTGTGGVQSSDISSLLSVPALFWSLGVAASELIFDGGQRRATVEQFTAQYRASVAAYRQTVLTAFQQVEDYTATLRVLSQQIEQQGIAVGAAQRNLELATARYETGLDPYLNVITAQNLLLGDQQTLVTLRVSQMTAAVQLVQALGGGWDVSKLPDP